MQTVAHLDESRLDAFMGQIVGDVGAAFNTVLTAIGDELGLYDALVDGGPMTAGELAHRTGTAARYVREWANTQAASGFLRYHPDGDRYELPPEQAFVLANETDRSPCRGRSAHHCHRWRGDGPAGHLTSLRLPSTRW